MGKYISYEISVRFAPPYHELVGFAKIEEGKENVLKQRVSEEYKVSVENVALTPMSCNEAILLGFPKTQIITV